MKFGKKAVSIQFILKGSYLLLLLLSILYVRNVLDEDSFKAVEKEIPEPVEKVTEVEVSLAVYEAGRETIYRQKLKSNDTVSDLLDELREKQGMLFEKDYYTFGTVIISVNRKGPPDGYEWAVFEDDRNITRDISYTYLHGGKNYYLRQTPKV